MRALVVEPVVLEGRWIRLEPLDLSHAADLVACCDEDIHQFFVTTRPLSTGVEDMASYIQMRQSMAQSQSFAVIWLETGKAIGCTSYMDIRASQLGLEIGMTWYAKAFQQTPVNPEAKLLLLRHAFEVLGCERVQLKTDIRNVQSQAAIEKLGAKKEGILRRHRNMPFGMSDTVMYSILPDEWPAVERGLQARLEIFSNKCR